MRCDRITMTLGAEVFGIDLGRDLDDHVGEQIHDALVQYGVLVFRDQPVSPETHLQLAAALGEIGVPHPLYEFVPRYPQINIIPNDAAHPPEAEVWHSDLTCKRNPPFASVLRGVVIPPVGGDTLWVDMVAACGALPAGLRAEVDGCRTYNTLGHAFRFLQAYGQVERQQQFDRTTDDTSAEHALIVRHPVSGAEVLFANESFTERIVGLSDADSARILAEVFALARHPRFQMRLRWRPDTIAIWDNWRTQHFASGDHYPMHERRMHRVTVASSRRAGPFSAMTSSVPD